MSGPRDGGSERLLDGLELRAGEAVLDLGRDGDPALAGLAERLGDAWVYAVRPSAAALEELVLQAHELGLPGVAYLVGEPPVLPLPDASVGACVARSGLGGGGDPAAAARELHRVLAPGGRLVVLADGDGRPLERALAEAGFADVRAQPAAGGEAGGGEPRALVRARRP